MECCVSAGFASLPVSSACEKRQKRGVFQVLDASEEDFEYHCEALESTESSLTWSLYSISVDFIVLHGIIQSSGAP